MVVFCHPKFNICLLLVRKWTFGMVTYTQPLLKAPYLLHFAESQFCSHHPHLVSTSAHSKLEFANVNFGKETIRFEVVTVQYVVCVQRGYAASLIIEWSGLIQIAGSLFRGTVARLLCFWIHVI